MPLIKEEALDQTTQIFRVSARLAEVHPLPIEWSLPIGDAVQNIRIALEYLAYELAALEADGQHSGGTKFPIAEDPSDYTPRDQATIGRLGPHWQIIERYQPYANGPASSASLWDYSFRILQKLSNQDKHNLLVPVAATMDLASVGATLSIILPGSGLSRVGRAGFNGGILVAGEELAWEEFHVVAKLGAPPPTAYVQQSYQPVAAHELAPSMPIADLLSLMHRKAAMLVEHFVALF